MQGSDRRHTSIGIVRGVPQDELVLPDGTRNWVVLKKTWNRESIQIFADFNSFRHGEDGQQDELWPSHPSSNSSLSFIDEKALPEPPYHVFDLRRKRQLVYIVSMAGLFSPLSSNIYFPALDTIATEFKVSIALLSLSVTVYMVVQGIAPSFWGPFSDTAGRRLIFIGTFTVYLVANVGLGLSKSFPALMFFRGLQAAGSAATISIGASVIRDITTSSERGGLIRIFGGIRMLGQSIGPVFGGILTQFLGFRSIFWFLTTLGAIALLLVIFFLPETLRCIAGNGTVRLSGIQRPVIYIIKGQPDASTEPLSDTPKRKISLSMVLSPLKFLGEKDVMITLFYGGIIYTTWGMVTSSTTALFQQRYHLNNLFVGLAFLPNGLGCVLGSYLTGYLMGHDYRRTELEYREKKGIAPSIQIERKALADFPIEKARMRNIWWVILIFTLATGVYGFSLNLPIAFPLVLQFFIAYTATAVFSMNSALIIDLYPGASASATAVNNLMRCTLGAIGVAVVQFVINAVGPGITFIAFAILTIMLSPLLIVEWKWGPRWRMQRYKLLGVRKRDGGHECS
ncbi:MFS general substrate transporter [Glonium stellatum]|uniref:MFS general substrate transporter n=1 Tax=Glonium stellatum TaxID=574774 RepID=A0A8E2EUL4_9PEZI|nr:MFS general substrate transporter [Glonium stellatum]